MATPVHTAAGLRARVVVAIDVCPNFWHERYEDMDWDQLAIRRLIEAVCAVGGFELPLTPAEHSA